MGNIKTMKNLEVALFNAEELNIWHRNHNKIEEYIQQNGVAPNELEENVILWMDIQIQIRHLLPAELEKSLFSFDYNLKANDISWLSMHNQLVGFTKKHGHSRPPADQNYQDLRDWLNRQILNKKHLTNIQFQKLDSLGIDWETAVSRDHGWDLMFLRLQKFKSASGHCRVPAKWDNDKQLGLWVVLQRRLYMQDKIREDRKGRLNQIEFAWNIQDQYNVQWNGFFQELSSFYEKNGHCSIPSKEVKLVSWMERQRVSKIKNLLLGDREKKLNDIQFTWNFDNIKDKHWDEMFVQLCDYRIKNGNSFVPVMCKENKLLGTWVATQRWLEVKAKLCSSKKKKLNEAGFVWSSNTQFQMKADYDFLWEGKFNKLKVYRQTNGTCQVSLKSDPELQRWTCWQRKMLYQGKLSAGRIDKLNELYFPWSIQEGYWMKMYDALVNFRIQYGHTKIPYRWQQNPQLSAWVYRIKLNQADFAPQKTELLNSIGFVWALQQKTMVSWEDMYGRLINFKEHHGHTRVPIKWTEDLKLGKWVGRMRYERKTLIRTRLNLLNAIHFDWGQGTFDTIQPHQTKTKLHALI